MTKRTAHMLFYFSYDGADTCFGRMFEHLGTERTINGLHP
jgi:hypothetical protein